MAFRARRMSLASSRQAGVHGATSAAVLGGNQSRLGEAREPARWHRRRDDQVRISSSTTLFGGDTPGAEGLRRLRIMLALPGPWCDVVRSEDQGGGDFRVDQGGPDDWGFFTCRSHGPGQVGGGHQVGTRFSSRLGVGDLLSSTYICCSTALLTRISTRPEHSDGSCSMTVRRRATSTVAWHKHAFLRPPPPISQSPRRSSSSSPRVRDEDLSTFPCEAASDGPGQIPLSAPVVATAFPSGAWSPVAFLAVVGLGAAPQPLPVASCCTNPSSPLSSPLSPCAQAHASLGASHMRMRPKQFQAQHVGQSQPRAHLVTAMLSGPGQVWLSPALQSLEDS